jgi:hypothetical protein
MAVRFVCSQIGQLQPVYVITDDEPKDAAAMEKTETTGC